MEEQIKFIAGYLYGCRAIFSGKNLEETDKALNRLAEMESELKKLRVADVSVSDCELNNEYNHFMDIDTIGACSKCGSMKQYEH